MAVTAYASSDANPIANPSVTAVVDLSAVALPQNVTLYADLIDSEDGAPTKTFQWYVVGSDPDNAPVLVNDDTDTVTVPLTTWYNCQMFVVGTNTNSGASSAAAFSSAPASAKVDIRVLEDDSGLERFARGQEISENVNNWAVQIRDNYDSLGNLTFSDIGDATISVTDLNKLADGSSMAGKHTHRGLDVAFASNTERGAVQFEEASSSGKVAARERHQFQGFYTGTLPAPSAVVPVMTWRVPYDMKIVGASVVAGDGGTGTQSFAVVWNNTTPHTPLIAVDIAFSVAPGAPNAAFSASDTPASESSIPEGDWISFMYTATTGTEPSDVMFQVEMRRDPG